MLAGFHSFVALTVSCIYWAIEMLLFIVCFWLKIVAFLEEMKTLKSEFNIMFYRKSNNENFGTEINIVKKYATER